MYGGFQGGPQLGQLMPRDASLSDSYKSVGDDFAEDFPAMCRGDTEWRRKFDLFQSR